MTASTWTRCGAYAFMLSMPWSMVFLGSFSPHDGARMLQTLVMCLAAWAWVQTGWTQRPQSGLVTLTLSIMLMLCAASVATAARPAHAGLEASAFLLLTAVALVFARTPTQTLSRELPPVLALAALLSLVMELPRMAFIYADGRVPVAGDFGFMYMNFRFLNHAESLLLPLAFLPLLLSAPRWVRVAAWIGLAGGLALLWRTGGRGTLIAMTLFVLGLPWLLAGQAKAVVRTVALGLTGGALIYALLFVLPAVWLGISQTDAGSAAQRLVGVNDAARIYLWKLAIADIAQRPLLGLGPMHYAHLPNAMAAHPHNSILQLAAEWGLPTTALMLMTLSMMFALRIRTIRAQPAGTEGRTLVAVCLLAALVGCVDSLVSGTLVMPVSQMWWVVAVGCTLAEPAGAAAVGERPRSTLPRALAALIVVIHLSLASYTYLLATQPWSEIPLGMFPRYWGNGQF
jgi:O-antigen ligase